MQKFILTIEDENVLTLPQEVLDHLGVRPGDRINETLLPDSVVLWAKDTAEEDREDQSNK